MDQCEAGQTCAYFQDNPNSNLQSFDNIGATLILLQVVSFDDWATPMFEVMEASSPWAWVYFVLVVVVGGFFIVNLFLAVIFDEFLAQKRVAGAVKAMDKRVMRLKWASSKALSLPKASTCQAPSWLWKRLRCSRACARDWPFPPGTPQEGPVSTAVTQVLVAAVHSPKVANYLMEKRHGVRANFLSGIATSDWLSTGSTALVVVNMLLMTMTYEGMTAVYAETIEKCQTAITLLFGVEMLIKLIGLGCAGYWNDGWNVLDGCIVIESLSELLIVDVLSSTVALPKLSFLRICACFASYVSAYEAMEGALPDRHDVCRIIPQMEASSCLCCYARSSSPFGHADFWWYTTQIRDSLPNLVREASVRTIRSRSSPTTTLITSVSRCRRSSS